MYVNISHIVSGLGVKLQEFLQNQWSQLLFSDMTPEKKENNLY